MGAMMGSSTSPPPWSPSLPTLTTHPRCRPHHRFHLWRNQHHQIRPRSQWHVENLRTIHGWFRRHFWVRIFSNLLQKRTWIRYWHSAVSSCPSVAPFVQRAPRPSSTRHMPMPTASHSFCRDSTPHARRLVTMCTATSFEELFEELQSTGLTLQPLKIAKLTHPW